MPPTIAIVGRPNVGKSTLFNRILGWKKAIVDDEPGVTRDRVSGTLLWKNRAVSIVDTGGLLSTGVEGLAGRVRTQTMTAIRTADAVICLFDGRAGLIPQDAEVARILRKTRTPVFYAANKIDSKNLEDLVHDFSSLGADRVFPISAETGLGVRELLDEAAGAACRAAGPDREVEAFANVSIIGRPNVGKSTLINRLLGEERALVDAIPGTTRDTLDVPVRHGDKTYLLIDTAGIRRRARVRDNIEFYSVRRSFQAIDRSDVSLLLLDGLEGPTSQDLKILSYIMSQGNACLLIVNKWDVLREKGGRKNKILAYLRGRHQSIPFLPILFISALTGEGVDAVFPCMDSVMQDYRRKVPTSRLNVALRGAVDASSPPSYRGKSVRILYATQIGSSPPAFVIFSNLPEGVPEGYRRYLEASLRRTFPFTGCPIELAFRRKT